MQLARGYQNVQEFSQRAVIEEWKKWYQKGKLLNSLKHHWKVYVPLVYGAEYEISKEERLSQKFLFHPMERFLCDDDPETVFQQLKEKDHPSQICGHVFKTGEPTYSCRDCANDLTCVLCIECFQKSIHKKHRYRMSSSNGGGYCDCGDLEAWKMAPVCEKHQKKEDQNEQLSPLSGLPDDLVDRASTLFLSALQYIVDILTWDQCNSLPEGLKTEETLDDKYITMLFNDEVHTFEQVISMLQKAVECSQKEAADFATTVDREGRSCVKSGSLNVCEKVQRTIETNSSRGNSKSLKVQVMHSSVVAHQQFTLKVIQWLQSIISKSDGLRWLFCNLAMKPMESNGSLMERLILTDTKLWKVARIQCHQLLMSGVLIDQECKKQFAIMFTKRYPQLMEDFLQDDHDYDVSVVSLSVQIFTVASLHYAALMQDFMTDDHYRSVSITSVSVQIFTVPTLARLLITEHNLLSVILQTFLQQCENKKNKDGKLSFDRSESGNMFKRTWFMLYDLKYALLCKPSSEEWPDRLRESFLNGFHAVLDLLKSMQGMDSVTRKTGQHLEIEPEWEGAFNLQLRLQDNIALLLEWCSRDRAVLVEAYRATVEALYECRDKLDAHKKEKCEVSGDVARCIKYDVSTQPVTIHLPLTRLLAGLHIHLGKYGLSFNSPDLLPERKLDALDLIEPPLRTQVMIAQTKASMWRRNGYSLLNQIFFYHNVRCRVEMHDKDIVMLQIGAALISSNDFLIHLLNKYGLLHWVKANYDNPGGQEDSVRQTVMLAEEFLTLLIIILGERYIPGVGIVSQDDVVKREIVHQLCISPMAHSELVKALPEDSNHETGIENVVNDVANFKKNHGNGKGRYELKPECFSWYNPYFYHYSRLEQSKSEEAQLKRKKQAGEDQAFPPPVPPGFTVEFINVVNILCCDVMIYIMELVLSRTAAHRSRSWSEAQFERILHLIGLALHEQKAAIEKGTQFDFITKASRNGDGSHSSIIQLLERLVGSENFTHESQRDLLNWILKTFSEIKMMKNEPVSMERIETLSTSLDAKWEQVKRKKAELAAKRRARIMAQMSAMQRNFIKDNPCLFEAAGSEMTPAGSDMDISESSDHVFPVALGGKQNTASFCSVTKATCILCQEDQEISYNGKAMVLSAFVQRSTVLSQSRGKEITNKEEHDPLLTSSDLFCGTYTSSCGHVMHADCWQRYFDAIVAKERRRPFRFRQASSYNIDKLEFLCPLCEAISNTVIPLVPPLYTLMTESDQREVQLSFNDWLDGIQKTVQGSVKEAEDKESEEESLLFQPCPISTITKMMAESVAKNFQLLWEYVYDDASGHFSEGVREMLKKFATDIYTFGLDVEPDGENPRVPIMAWNTCAYTIQVTEQNLQDEQKPLFGSLSSRRSDCLNALVKFSSVFGQVMPPDLVKQHCVRLLTALIPGNLDKKRKETCILDLDLFHYLTVLVMTLPTLHAEGQASSISSFPSGHLNDQHALQLVLTAHLVQILLVYEPKDQELMETETDSDDEDLVLIYKRLREQAGITSETSPCPWLLSHHVKQACLPFLRCTALMYYYITGTSAPFELQECRSNEFECVCRFLSLPTRLHTLLQDQDSIITHFIMRWCSHSSIKDRFTASNQQILSYPRPVNQLIPLPDDYSELMNQVSSFTCPRSSGDESRVPTMCLVCGQILCSQSYCCQIDIEKKFVGAATAHTYTCGAGIGIFLRVRDCQIILLAGQTKGCFRTAPYLDDYGETDQYLKRGNPLKLSKERYKLLHKLWFCHEIPEMIVHNLESSNNLLSYDWWNL